MSDELSFISSLAKAFDQRGREPIKRAVNEILKEDSERTGGIPQFHQFMAVISSQIECEILLFREEALIASLSLLSGRDTATGLRPGTYTLMLSTGRVLWQGELSQEQVLWDKAFPDESLPLAADTGTDQDHSTVRQSLLDGEILMSVCPGLGAGSVQIERANSV
ncbi:MAG: hypothetical protein HY735_13060 [Verrucomicrobia bacterium]|nr:hypothetical protein [Verrucomicrobiota bacterium]